MTVKYKPGNNKPTETELYAQEQRNLRSVKHLFVHFRAKMANSETSGRLLLVPKKYFLINNFYLGPF